MVYESEFCLSRMNVFINTEDYQHRRECIHQQLSGKSWEADSSIGQKSSCEEYAPHTAKYILGGGRILYNIRHFQCEQQP